MNNFPDFSSHDYQIIQELGCNREGGRISYLAAKISSTQQVVIKQFRFAQGNSSWNGFKAYEREIQILQELNHPRIPRYLDSFETSDGFCLVQEYKQAVSLATKQSFKLEEIRQIAVSVLEILVDLQDRVPPIIHRDLKPENILVDRNNQAFLIDFGLARLNSQEVALSSVAAGTPGFMPPEELFNRPLTEAADLYSLGATLLCLITNTPSVKISNLLDDNYRFNLRQVETTVNSRFLSWLKKMVEPNSKDRYANAKTALQALQSIDIDSKTAFNQYLPKVGVVFLFSLISISVINSLLSPSGVEPDISNTNNPSNLGQQWFNQIRPRCNPVEVNTTINNNPPPDSPEGIAYAASCYALAGKIKQAEQIIERLSPDARVYAVSIVFEIGHPVADAGDDESAEPIMDLVLKYWPENYMAVYHAGMSAYILGNYPKANHHLRQFLDMYQNQDVWRDRAINVLNNIEQGIPAEENFVTH